MRIKMIYIDLLSTMKINGNIAQYTGGSNYALNIINTLNNANDFGEKIAILVPRQCNLKSNDKNTVIKVDSLLDYDFGDARLLFLPQVNGKVLSQIGKIKEKNPKMLIYGTLHDRQHNYFKRDNYDDFYYDSFYEKVKSRVMFIVKKVYFDLNYEKWIENFDKVFTVSNYSMQRLYKYNMPYIKYFYQETKQDVIELTQSSICKKENYAILVSAGRPEKNALRTIQAFCAFHEKQNSDLKLVLTGINDRIINNFVKSKKFDNNIFKEYVKCFGYVSNEELNSLYRNAQFVVFLSKAEGFGLPVLEAIMNEKVVLASMLTSIPEVGGGSVLYADPYSVDSIVNGFKILTDKRQLEKYKKYICEKRKVLKEQIELDKKIFVDEIFGR